MSGTLRFYLEGALVYERLDVNLNLASLPLQCAGRVSAFEGHSGEKTQSTAGVLSWPFLAVDAVV